MTTALFIGRFQPFHKAHLEVIKDILKENQEVIIAIGSSQFSNEPDNPFSYDERKDMITESLEKNKISNYAIVELPDQFDDERWMEYILSELPSFDVFYSGNEMTQEIFSQEGIKVIKVILFEGINGTEIRDKIAKEEKWEHLVPETISDFIKKVDGVERIKKSSSN